MTAVQAPTNMPSPAIVPSSSSSNNNKRRRSTKANNKASSEQQQQKNDTPIFLRKTYHMIETCDPQIATWTVDNDGSDTFVVKNVDRFEAEVIPQFFKHNHFKSFVRQLNFYGFRKVRDQSILVNDEQKNEQWCQFHHPLFRKGRPDLLSEIKKPHQKEPADKEEVDGLKSEVKDLKSQVKTLRSDMEVMANLMGHMKRQLESLQGGFQGSAMVEASDLSQPALKKLRTITPPSSDVDSSSVPVSVPAIPPTSKATRQQSEMSLSPDDIDSFLSLLNDDEGQMFDILPDSIVS